MSKTSTAMKISFSNYLKKTRTIQKSISAAIILIAILSFIGCSSSPKNGVYFLKTSPMEYFELKDNHRFFIRTNESLNVIGKYEIDAEVMTFVFEGGNAKRFEIKDSYFLDEQGAQWMLWTGGETGIAYEKERIAIQSNKDAIINDINNLEANAYQYYIRPKSNGGGEGSYVGYVMPDKMASTKNAKYAVETQTSTINIKATSAQNSANKISATFGNDGILVNGWIYDGDFQE